MENQNSRYGAISKSYPMVTGKAFFLVNASEFAAAEYIKKYPVDSDGVVRVYTTWAAVISAIQANTDYDVVIVSPLFTTAPTKAQQLQLDAAGCVVWQAGQLLPDGSYLAATATALSLATATTNGIFAVTGRVELIHALGEVTTTSIGTGANAKLTMVPTVGSTTDLCATATTSSLPVGANLTITGTLANAMVTTVQGAFIKQATPIILTAGTLNLVTSATTVGNVKYRLVYRALDPGAFVTPLA